MAAALSLGPCLLVAASDKHRSTNRPFEKLSAALGHRKQQAHNVLSYHITLAAEFVPLVKHVSTVIDAATSGVGASSRELGVGP